MKIVPLATPSSEANAECIERLEETLEAAKRGDMIGIAIAYVKNDGSVATSHTKSPNAIALLGGIKIIGHRLLKSMSNEY